MDFAIPEKTQKLLAELDAFIEDVIKPIEQEDVDETVDAAALKFKSRLMKKPGAGNPGAAAGGMSALAALA